MKSIVLYSLFFFLWSNIGNSGDDRNTLPLIEIVNKDLNLLINNFLDYEENYNCYHKDYFYVISIGKKEHNGPTYFFIEGLGPFISNLLSTDKFFFIRNGNTFLVRGNPPKTWYRKTSIIKKIDLYRIQEDVYVPSYDLSRWACSYRDGVFSILEKYECGYKPTINNFRRNDN